MANLPETATWDAGVYQIETTDPVLGGPTGVTNAPLKNLANRTAYLKEAVDTLGTQKAPLASPVFTGAPTAPTAAPGTNTTQLSTTAFVLTAVAAAVATLVTSVAGRTGAVVLTVADVAGAAPLASPAFSGAPTAPTAAPGSSNTQLATTSFVQAAATMAAPSAMVAHFARATPPAGWLKADGSAVSRTFFAALFSAIGTTFGIGDGSTTFNLPDLRGEFLRGWDDGRGLDVGRSFGTVQGSQNLSHNHGGATPAAGEHTHTATTNFGSTPSINQPYRLLGDDGAFDNIVNSSTPGVNSAGEHQHGIPVDGGSEARPRNITLLACIKF
ncbi:MAG: phage tail protein [Hydrogenophaga sp.]|uniref:phage tail protein n=1 Tax=Hydrogenophaga sp. TaxID=1904254 RepID=UPI00271BE101|nr:phage tail protein [Hydrogenophaga sp.]MDO9571172.1 phage tail protein [Hydrogenophaga sp.]